MKNSFLSQFDKVSEISKGMSGDKKYRVEKGGGRHTFYEVPILLNINEKRMNTII